MEIYDEWFLKAMHDLEGAKILNLHGHLKDLTVYHTQQCGEKALKGYLMFRKHPLEKTHDLNKLLIFCQSYEPMFNQLASKSAFLNGFDVKYRYPDEELEPTNQEADTAIEYAAYILNFVQQQITK